MTLLPAKSRAWCLRAERAGTKAGGRGVKTGLALLLLLDLGNTILIAEDAADIARQLIALLADPPDDDTLTHLAAAVLRCEVLDIIIHTETK